MTRPTRPTDLHALAQALAAAGLSVDAAEAFLDRGEMLRLRNCLHAAAAAVADAGAWIEARRIEEAGADVALPGAPHR